MVWPVEKVILFFGPEKPASSEMSDILEFLSYMLERPSSKSVIKFGEGDCLPLRILSSMKRISIEPFSTF